jgi:nuclear pore complex protein Nup160
MFLSEGSIRTLMNLIPVTMYVHCLENRPTLISLFTELSLIRFVFPAAILSYPALFSWGSHELHILAVMDTGSLYGLVLPFGRAHEPWLDQVQGNWCREYVIKNTTGIANGLDQVQGTHGYRIPGWITSASRPKFWETIAVAVRQVQSIVTCCIWLKSISPLDDWTESLSQHDSFLHSLTSFLPALYPSTSDGSEIVSMATQPWLTDVGHIWTISWDRTLQLWRAKIVYLSRRSFRRSQGESHYVLTWNPIKPRTLLEPGKHACS